VKAEGTPFSTVFESKKEAKKVIPTLKSIRQVSIKADRKEPPAPLTKNIVITLIRRGNRPLQGTRLLVRIAISRSLFESMIRQPIIPAALQPKPIHIVSDCLPQALHFLKPLSRQKAILGKYPESSNNVKSGKNIAIGGNITDTIQASVLKIP
jgi:hypothetical protein